MAETLRDRSTSSVASSASVKQPKLLSSIVPFTLPLPGGIDSNSNEIRTGKRIPNCLVVFPVVFAFIIPGLILSCYIQGLLKNHFHMLLPLVSDTGNYIPEAATFTAIITAVGILFMIIGTIRYLQLRAIIRSNVFEQIINTNYEGPIEPNIVESQRNYCYRMNLLTYIAGLVVAGSCSATGSFRLSESFAYHNISAAGIFFCSPAYFYVHTDMSKLMRNFVNTEETYRIRKRITKINLISFGVFVSTMLFMFIFSLHMLPNPVQRLFWNPTDHGWTYWIHLFNSIAEWVFLLTVSPYIYTFAYDFSRLGYSNLQLEYYFLHQSDEQMLLPERVERLHVAAHRLLGVKVACSPRLMEQKQQQQPQSQKQQLPPTQIASPKVSSDNELMSGVGKVEGGGGGGVGGVRSRSSAKRDSKQSTSSATSSLPGSVEDKSRQSSQGSRKLKDL